MTSKETQTLGVYCVLAYIVAYRVETGNLWVRLAIGVVAFFVVPAACYAWTHRHETVPA